MVGFPGGAVVKNPPANAGDGRDRILIPGKIPWGRKCNPFQYSCLEIPWTEEPGAVQRVPQRARHY